MLDKKHLEFLPAVFELLWGLWIINPWENTFAITSAYRIMAGVMPEWAWGALLLVLGIIQLIVIFRGTLHMRAISSVTCLFIFLSLALLIFFGNPASVTIPTYLIFAICEWFAYTEVLADIKAERRK
jgi:hypothetical protein